MTPTGSQNCSRLEPHPIRGYFLIAAATLFWSISATLGRAAFTGRLLGAQSLTPIDPLILAQTRTTISFLVLAPILLLLRGRSALTLPARDFGKVLLLGVVGVASSNYFYYFAIQRTNVAVAIILQYTAPVLVLIYMVARRLQRPNAQRVTSVFLALAGVLFAIGVVGTGGLRLDTYGVVAAELAAVAFASYNVGGAALVQQHDRWKVIVNAFLGAAIFWIIVNPPWRIVAAHYSGAQWLFLVVFAICSILVPFSLYFAGLQQLDPTRAIVTSCLEPVFSILIAGLILGETLRPLQIVGVVLVLVATVLVQMPERRGVQPAVVVEPME